MLEYEEEKKISLSARAKIFLASIGLIAVTNLLGVNLGYASYVLWIIVIALAFYKIVDLAS